MRNIFIVLMAFTIVSAVDYKGSYQIYKGAYNQSGAVPWDSIRITACTPDSGYGSDTVILAGTFSGTDSIHIAMGDSTISPISITDTTVSLRVPLLDTGCYDFIVSDTVSSDTLICGFYIKSNPAYSIDSINWSESTLLPLMAIPFLLMVCVLSTTTLRRSAQYGCRHMRPGWSM
jgi:hypothetical protein